MSTLDQPILIANSNYHVGHQVAIVVAKEKEFLRRRRTERIRLRLARPDSRPDRTGRLAMAMTNHGVDIATAVDVEAAIHQRAEAPTSHCRWLALYAVSQLVRR